MHRRIAAAGALFVLAVVGCATKEETSLKIYVQQKLYDKAILQGTKALQKDPNNGDTHYFLGAAYFGKDGELRPEEEGYADSSEAFLKAAYTHFLKSKELAPGTWGKSSEENIVSMFGRHYNRGVIAAKKDDKVTAATEYRLAKVADPENYQGYYAHAAAVFPMARDAKKAGDEEEFNRITDAVLADLTKVLELNPAERSDRVNTHQSLGDVLYMRGDVAGAQQHYTKAVDMDPENYDLMITMADRFFNEQDWDNAATYYDRAMGVQERLNLVDEGDTATYQYLAQCQVNLGRREDAIATFDKVLKLKPNDPTTMYNIMVTYYKAGEAADRDGHTEVAKQNYLQGIAIGTELTRIDASKPEYWQVLGYCQRGVGNTAEAARSLKRFQELRQQSSR